MKVKITGTDSYSRTQCKTEKGVTEWVESAAHSPIIADDLMIVKFLSSG